MSATGKGFTLLELLVVLAILALLVAALPIAMAQVFPRQRLRVCAQDVVVALRTLRNAAVDSSEIESFGVSENGHAWRSALNASPTALPNGMTVEIKPATAAPSNDVRFYPDGSSSGGTVDLTFKSRNVRVRVSPMTGRIALEETT